MVNKKLEITLGEKKYQLWFNNYAVFELQKMYGIEQSQVLTKVSERANDNYLLLIGDLIKVGIKGHALAKGKNTPDVLGELHELLAVADLKELMQVWTVFFDIMGGNLKKEEGDKKKAEKKPRKKKS